MSRNGGSDILVAAVVATGSSLSIGLGAVLLDFVSEMTSPAVTKQASQIEREAITDIRNGISIHIRRQRTLREKLIKTLTNFIAPHGNEPTSLFDMPECKEPKDYRSGGSPYAPRRPHQVSQHISQNCKDIYHASVFAILNEKSKTNKPPSQKRLEEKSREAAKKKWQELRLAGSVTTVTISTTVLIADIAVAPSGRHDKRRAN